RARYGLSSGYACAAASMRKGFEESPRYRESPALTSDAPIRPLCSPVSMNTVSLGHSSRGCIRIPRGVEQIQFRGILAADGKAARCRFYRGREISKSPRAVNAGAAGRNCIPSGRITNPSYLGLPNERARDDLSSSRARQFQRELDPHLALGEAGLNVTRF